MFWVGRTVLRQQLQQHLRNQNNALRGFSDYVRRNMKLVLELAMDRTPSPGGWGGPAGGAAAVAGAPRITAREVDRLAFLLRLAKPRQGTPYTLQNPKPSP